MWYPIWPSLRGVGVSPSSPKGVSHLAQQEVPLSLDGGTLGYKDWTPSPILLDGVPLGRLDGGTPSIRLDAGTPIGGCAPILLDGVTPQAGWGYPPETEQHIEYLLHGGLYASCIQARGLSCILFIFILSQDFRGSKCAPCKFFTVVDPECRRGKEI